MKSVTEKNMETEIGRLVMAVRVLLARRFDFVVSDLEQWHRKVGTTAHVKIQSLDLQGENLRSGLIGCA
jgi:hypothetical protein